MAQSLDTTIMAQSLDTTIMAQSLDTTKMTTDTTKMTTDTTKNVGISDFSPTTAMDDVLRWNLELERLPAIIGILTRTDSVLRNALHRDTVYYADVDTLQPTDPSENQAKALALRMYQEVPHEISFIQIISEGSQELASAKNAMDQLETDPPTSNPVSASNGHQSPPNTLDHTPMWLKANVGISNFSHTSAMAEALLSPKNQATTSPQPTPSSPYGINMASLFGPGPKIYLPNDNPGKAPYLPGAETPYSIAKKYDNPKLGVSPPPTAQSLDTTKVGQPYLPNDNQGKAPYLPGAETPYSIAKRYNNSNLEFSPDRDNESFYGDDEGFWFRPLLAFYSTIYLTKDEQQDTDMLLWDLLASSYCSFFIVFLFIGGFLYIIKRIGIEAEPKTSHP